jgi:hypothetical protein
VTGRRLTQAEIEQFAYGEAGELEVIILSDPEYLETLEAIWAEEMPRDLRAPVLRALQMEQFVSGVVGATLDVAFKFGEAMAHYLKVSVEDTPET